MNALRLVSSLSFAKSPTLGKKCCRLSLLACSRGVTDIFLFRFLGASLLLYFKSKKRSSFFINLFSPTFLSPFLSLFFLDFFFSRSSSFSFFTFFLISFYVQAAKRSVRTTGVQHRTFVDGLQNAKSAVAARQLHYQDPAKAHLHGADDPTYLKNGSGDKITFGLGMGLFGFSVLSVGSGMWNMAHGTGKLN